jgi:hypothetical protein
MINIPCRSILTQIKNNEDSLKDFISISKAAKGMGEFRYLQSNVLDVLLEHEKLVQEAIAIAGYSDNAFMKASNYKKYDIDLINFKGDVPS